MPPPEKYSALSSINPRSCSVSDLYHWSNCSCVAFDKLSQTLVLYFALDLSVFSIRFSLNCSPSTPRHRTTGIASAACLYFLCVTSLTLLIYTQLARSNIAHVQMPLFLVMGQHFQPEKKNPSLTGWAFSWFSHSIGNRFLCTCFHVALFQVRETKPLQAELVLTKAPFTISNFTTKLNFFSRSCQSHSPSANRHNMTLPTLGETALKRNAIGGISH